MAVLLGTSTEPRYGGYPLSNWVKLLSDINVQDFGPDCTEDKAPGAILAIGTNALPFLVEWLRYERGPTPVRDAVYKGVQNFPVLQRIGGLQDWAAQDTREVRSAGSLVAFRILGPTAAPAIPQLVRLASKKAEPFAPGPQEAVEALAGIGQTALPALLSIATNRTIQFTVRSDAAEDIGQFGTNAAPAIPILLDILENDDDRRVADGAAEALGAIGLEPRRVVPALIKAALRPGGMQLEVIGALAKFGPKAADAIPTLQQVVDAKNKYADIRRSDIRRSAVAAIAEIQTSNATPHSPSP